jgi:hypothetical protein
MKEKIKKILKFFGDFFDEYRSWYTFFFIISNMFIVPIFIINSRIPTDIYLSWPESIYPNWVTLSWEYLEKDIGLLRTFLWMFGIPLIFTIFSYYPLKKIKSNILKTNKRDKRLD